MSAAEFGICKCGHRCNWADCGHRAALSRTPTPPPVTMLGPSSFIVYPRSQACGAPLPPYLHSWQPYMATIPPWPVHLRRLCDVWCICRRRIDHTDAALSAGTGSKAAKKDGDAALAGFNKRELADCVSYVVNMDPTAPFGTCICGRCVAHLTRKRCPHPIADSPPLHHLTPSSSSPLLIPGARPLASPRHPIPQAAIGAFRRSASSLTFRRSALIPHSAGRDRSIPQKRLIPNLPQKRPHPSFRRPRSEHSAEAQLKTPPGALSKKAARDTDKEVALSKEASAASVRAYSPLLTPAHPF